MPIKISKVKGGYRVSTPSGVKARKTSRKKAEAQCRLINAAEHNPEFRRKLADRALKS